MRALSRAVAPVLAGVVAGLSLPTGCGSDFVLGARVYEDLYVQPPAVPVDVLFVVDNSKSMQGEGEEQQRVADAFDDFIVNLSEADIEFHIGVTTTDMSDENLTRPGTEGRLVEYTASSTRYRYITYEMAESLYQQVFTGMINLIGGSDGAGYEKGLYAAKTALFPTNRGGKSGDGGYNAGFLRDDARLAIIFVSDEDDCSDDDSLGLTDPEQCYSQYNQLRPVSEYVDDYLSLKRADSDIVVGAIIGPTGLDPDTACAKATGEGRRYITATEAFGGVTGSICESDFSQILQQMGLAAASFMTTFPLEVAPDLTSLQVFIDDVEIPAGQEWVYDAEAQAIVFQKETAPQRGSSLRIRYQAA